MLSQKSIPDIIEIAEACIALDYASQKKQKLFNGAEFDQSKLQFLKWYKRRVKWMDESQPSFFTLRKTANYLYSLCNARNAAIAENIIQSQGGRVIYNPQTGQVLNGLIFQELEYVVGASGSPLTNGMTNFIISDSAIIAGTLDVLADGIEVPMNLSDRFSYGVTYTSSQINVTFNQPLQPNQVILFKYVKGGQVSSGSQAKFTQPTIFVTPSAGATSFQVPSLLGIPLSDIIFLFRGNFPRQVVANPTSDMNQMQFTSSNGTFTYPIGDSSYGDEVFAISYMI